MDRSSRPDLEQIRQLAAELAESDDGPAGELACRLSDAVLGLSDRIDALWQLISAVVESAGLGSPAASPAGSASQAPPEFVQALNLARAGGRRGVRLSIDGREWVAALSRQPPASEHEAWAAIERLTKSTDQDDR